MSDSIAQPLSHGVYDDMACPNCDAKPLRCAYGSCQGCGHKLLITVESEL